MKASKVVFLVFLITLSLCAVNTRPVRAQSSGTIYIRSDGSVDPSTAPIQRDGNVYTFTSNINDSIVVERENIVVDGAGYKLQGTGSGCGMDVTRISNAGNVTIKNVQITYFSWGIGLHSHSCTVSGNNITNCVAGVKVMSSHNKITGNYFTANLSNTVGILIQQDSKNKFVYGNIIYGNTMIGNTVGIEIIETKSTNIILGNNITRNKYGIYSVLAADQIIHHNNFINNTNQVMDNALEPLSALSLSVHVWDNGSQGNYWSDYNGTDGDGVGDTPYQINSKGEKYNQDSYPLMKPVDISAVVIPELPDTFPPIISIVSPENKTYTVPDVPLTLTVDEPTSWIGYSLDKKATVTITGNTTLTGLSYDSHSLTVYANDTLGNTGTSETIYFTIAQKTEPQQEPFPTTWIVAAAAAIIVVIAVAALILKRRGK